MSVQTFDPTNPRQPFRILTAMATLGTSRRLDATHAVRNCTCARQPEINDELPMRKVARIVALSWDGQSESRNQRLHNTTADSPARLTQTPLRALPLGSVPRISRPTREVDLLSAPARWTGIALETPNS